MKRQKRFGMIVWFGCLLMGGVAIRIESASPTLRHLTITNNGKGGFCVHASEPTITNCILWGDGSDDLKNCEAQYSCIERVSQAYGEGNIVQDPLFADPEQGDYHLRSAWGRYLPAVGGYVRDVVTSPCIDAGDPMVNVGQEPDTHGVRINMGAFGGTAQASQSSPGTPVVKPHESPRCPLVEVANHANSQPPNGSKVRSAVAQSGSAPPS